jgi:thiol:disulfide interchange protein DsbA
MKLSHLLLICWLVAPLSLFADDTFIEGKDYKVLKTESKPNTVIEFFNPGCPACFHAEPAIEAWLKTKSASVQFTRTPLSFHKEWEIYSRAYYVAVGLKIENKMLPTLFNAIQTQHKGLQKPSEMAALFMKVRGEHYTAAQIQATLNSVMVTGQLSAAQQQMDQYQIEELPSFVVSGKYFVSGSLAKSPERMMQVVTYLLATTSQTVLSHPQ